MRARRAQDEVGRTPHQGYGHPVDGADVRKVIVRTLKTRLELRRFACRLRRSSMRPRKRLGRASVRLRRQLVFLLLLTVEARAVEVPIGKLRCGDTFLVLNRTTLEMADEQSKPVSVTKVKFCFVLSEESASFSFTVPGKKPTAESWVLMRHKTEEPRRRLFTGYSKDYDESAQTGVSHALQVGEDTDGGGFMVTASVVSFSERKHLGIAVFFHSDGRVTSSTGNKPFDVVPVKNWKL